MGIPQEDVRRTSIRQYTHPAEGGVEILLGGVHNSVRSYESREMISLSHGIFILLFPNSSLELFFQRGLFVENT